MILCIDILHLQKYKSWQYKDYFHELYTNRIKIRILNKYPSWIKNNIHISFYNKCHNKNNALVYSQMIVTFYLQLNRELFDFIGILGKVESVPQQYYMKLEYILK